MIRKKISRPSVPIFDVLSLSILCSLAFHLAQFSATISVSNPTSKSAKLDKRESSIDANDNSENSTSKNLSSRIPTLNLISQRAPQSVKA